MTSIPGDPTSVPARLRGGDPAQLGAYRLVNRLGEGGMGTVYLGEASDGRRVAVKAIRADLADNPRFVARFRREAENARKVVGHCTAQVLDDGVDGGRPYLEVVRKPRLIYFPVESSDWR